MPLRLAKQHWKLIALIVGTSIVCTLTILTIQQRQWHRYEAGAISFVMPKSWDYRPCQHTPPSFAIPGHFRTTYAERKVSLYFGGSLEGHCSRNDEFILHKDMYKPTNEPDDGTCGKDQLVASEELANELTILVHGWSDRVTALYVVQGNCNTTVQRLMNMSLLGADAWTEELLKYGTPYITKEVLLASQQYKDIKRMAESIQIQDK